MEWSEHGQPRWFPTAGNWANNERLVNLSYFLPYAYPEFDKLDPEGQWLAAVNAVLVLAWLVLAWHVGKIYTQRTAASAMAA